MPYQSQQANVLGISNAIIPKEGPKTLRVNLDFTLGVSAVTVDLSQQYNKGQLSMVQTLYVNNIGNAQAITVYIAATDQTLTVPAGQQIYVPVLSPQPMIFQFSSGGGVIVPVHFINVPLPFGETQGGSLTGGGFKFDGSGNLLVADAALEALISKGGMNVNVIAGGGGGGTKTPSDAYNNPTDGTDSVDLGMLYDQFSNQWARERASYRQAPFVASGNRGTVGSVDLTLINAKAITFLISVTNVGAGASIVFDFRLNDLYYTLQGFPVARLPSITATGVYSWQIGPGLIADAVPVTGVTRSAAALAKECNLLWTPAVGAVEFSVLCVIHN